METLIGQKVTQVIIPFPRYVLLCYCALFCVVFWKYFQVSDILQFLPFLTQFDYILSDLLPIWLSILLCVWRPDMRASVHYCPQAFFIFMTLFANGAIVHMGQKIMAILRCSKVSVTPNPVLMLGVWCSFQGELWHKGINLPHDSMGF